MKKNTHQHLERNSNAKPAITVSLSAELARPDDDVRRRTAQRWNAALHRLCILRSAANETAYDTEWACIFDEQRAMADIKRRSKLLGLAAVEVLQIQHEYRRLVSDEAGLHYDDDVSSEMVELLLALKLKIERGLE
jgi:hypothetical protein